MAGPQIQDLQAQSCCHRDKNRPSGNGCVAARLPRLAPPVMQISWCLHLCISGIKILGNKDGATQSVAPGSQETVRLQDSLYTGNPDPSPETAWPCYILATVPNLAQSLRGEPMHLHLLRVTLAQGLLRRAFMPYVFAQDGGLGALITLWPLCDAIGHSWGQNRYNLT